MSFADSTTVDSMPQLLMSRKNSFNQTKSKTWIDEEMDETFDDITESNVTLETSA